MLDKIYHTLFLSTPSARRATRCPLCERLRDLRFLSTPSARRATLFRVLGGKPYQNFYPRPPRGGRPRRICNTAGARSFLSTPSARRATATPPIPENSFEFLSTPSARRATSNGLHSKIHHKISIHALREEGDHRHKQAAEDLHHFYPRPPRGGRLHAVFCPRLLVAISIHALREEGDAAIPEYYWRKLISIHALREEGDGLHHHLHGARRHFYPRPPRGGRLEAYIKPLGLRLFLSTPSARRATAVCDLRVVHLTISIHALREEGDRCLRSQSRPPHYFYPRPPRGGRQRLFDGLSQPFYISIHALREEGDANCPASPLHCFYFYPRPPRGGRPAGNARHFNLNADFYPRPPRGGRRSCAASLSRALLFLSTPSARRATPSLWSRSITRRNFYPRPPRGGRPAT